MSVCHSQRLEYFALGWPSEEESEEERKRRAEEDAKRRRGGFFPTTRRGECWLLPSVLNPDNYPPSPPPVVSRHAVIHQSPVLLS